MLPDFPTLRRELEKHLIVRLTALVHQKEPILAQITGLTLHEGDTIAYDQMTEAGTRTVSEDFKEGRAEFSVAYKDVATCSGEKLEAKLNEIAEDLARQHSEAVQASKSLGARFLAGVLAQDKAMGRSGRPVPVARGVGDGALRSARGVGGPALAHSENDR